MTPDQLATELETEEAITLRTEEADNQPLDPRAAVLTPVPAPTLSVSIPEYEGIAAAPFSAEQIEGLLSTIPEEDIEIRPDGLIYLPEIRYRRVLNRTFGPGAWALLPRSIDIQDNMLYYRGALFVHGRFVSEAIGEQQYFVGNDRMSYATAAEAAKSNCLVRCCKDLGIASELWDPSFIRTWLAKYALEVWCTSRQDSSKRKKFWRKRSAGPIDSWPWTENEPAKLPPARHDESAPINESGPAPISDVTAQPRGEGEGRNATRSDARQGNHGSNQRLISERQAARFRAIAREYGWSEADAQKLLSRYGFSGPEKVTRAAYEEICHRLENPGSSTLGTA